MDERQELLQQIRQLTQRVEALERTVETLRRPVQSVPSPRPPMAADRSVPPPGGPLPPGAQGQRDLPPPLRGQPAPGTVPPPGYPPPSPRPYSQKHPRYVPPGTMDRPYPLPPPPPRPARQEGAWERKVGKQVMAIAASVLIFFSFILFARVIYIYLTDGVKTILLYGLSAGFSAFGLTKMHKEQRYYALFAALAGCGVGGSYLTSILAYFIFGVVSRPVLFVLIAAWTVGTSYLSKKKSSLFTYIGHIGILLSTILCIADRPGSILALMCYWLGTGILFAFNFTGDGDDDLFFFLQYPCVMAVLALVYRQTPAIHVLILASLLAVYIARHFLYEDTVPRHDLLALLLTMVSMAVNCLFLLWEGKGLGIACVWAFTAVLVVWSLYTFKGGILAKIPYYTALVTLPLLPYAGTILPSDAPDYVQLLPFVAVYSCLGFWGKSAYTRLVASVYFFLYLQMAGSIPPLLYLVSGAGLTGAHVVCTYCLRKDVHPLDKYCILACGAVFAYGLIEYLPGPWERGILIPLVGLSAFANARHFRNTESDRDVARIVGYLFNLCVMFLCTVAVWEGAGDVLCRGIVVLCAIAAYSLNTLRLFDHGAAENWAGYYIGIKFTYLLYMVLKSMGGTGVVLSIMGLLLAIASIVAGFLTRHKSLRLYGLVLSMAAVAKTLLLDISYGSALLRPVGFFAAGLLCFGISCIYSRLENDLDRRE